MLHTPRPNNFAACPRKRGHGTHLLRPQGPLAPGVIGMIEGRRKDGSLTGFVVLGALRCAAGEFMVPRVSPVGTNHIISGQVANLPHDVGAGAYAPIGGRSILRFQLLQEVTKLADGLMIFEEDAAGGQDFFAEGLTASGIGA